MRVHTRTSQFLNRAWKIDTRTVPAHLVDDPTFIPRLTWRTTPRVPTTSSDFTETIERAEGHAWFCDSSFIDDHRDNSVIEALLAAPARLHLVAPVRAELEPWLKRRPRHPLTLALRDNNPTIVKPAMPSAGNGASALNYYAGLLAMRRRVARVVRASVAAEDAAHEPQDESAVLAHIQRQFGERGRLLATKAPGPLHTDEILVYVAVAHALQTGQPTMILANDADVEEQFFKLMWLMNGHYRAMHCARSYMKDPLAHRVVSLPASALSDPDLPVEPAGAVLVYGNWGPNLEGALPSTGAFVPISCLNGGSRVTQITFGGERGMADLLHVKDKTHGLSSDLLGARNVHAHVPENLAPDDGREGVLIARDRVLQAAEPLRISVLDAHFAILNSERPGRLRLVSNRSGRVLLRRSEPGPE